MTNSVTFPVNLGGDGSTVTDDDNASTGLGNGGHRTRFVPAMGQVVAVANTLTQRIVDNSDTSTSSVAIATGNKTFVTAGFYEWAVGMWVTITSAANPANFMFGQVTSYTSGTKTLIVDVDTVGGSGTLSDWTIALSAFNPSGSYLTVADIGVTVQGYDGDLAAIAALAGSSGVLKKTGANTWELDTGTFLESTDIGVTVQGYDADTVKGDVATTFTAQQVFGNSALTDASTIAWDVSTKQVATFTFVSSNRTMGAPTNLVNGGFYALAVIQNAGSNTLTWNSVFKWASGAAPTLSTAAGAKDYFVFRSDGSNMIEQGRSLNVS